MASTDSKSNLSPAFAYTIVYVNDVAKSVSFYSKAFGYEVRRLDDSGRWGELESGATTIAFTRRRQRETEDDVSGRVEWERNPVEVCFDYWDVDAAYQRAIHNGAVPVSPPDHRDWGQKVAYVRDIDGIVVRLGTHVSPPPHMTPHS